MTELKIDGAAGKSTIHLDSGLEMLPTLIKDQKTVIITDENVMAAQGHRFAKVHKVLVVPPGEQSKSFDHAGRLLSRLIDLNLDRQSLIVGVGGGVVTDLAGFLASVLLRGVSFGFVATSVLAQVDAAIGGKNGVNLEGYKNLVGIIRQPRFVVNDTTALGTLPRHHLINGLSEVIKSGVIGDETLFTALERTADTKHPVDALDLGMAVSRAAAVKVGVVNRDVFEKGERRHLNLGHTYGHAVEKLTPLDHGFSVAVGMVAAARIAVRKKVCSENTANRIERVIDAFELPLTADVSLESAMDAISRDKKRSGDRILFVLPKTIGQAVVEPIELAELKEVLGDLH